MEPTAELLIGLDNSIGYLKSRIGSYTDCAFVIYDTTNDTYYHSRGGEDDIYFSKDEIVQVLYDLMSILKELIVFASYEDGIDCVNIVVNGGETVEDLSSVAKKMTAMGDDVKFKEYGRPSWVAMNTSYDL